MGIEVLGFLLTGGAVSALVGVWAAKVKGNSDVKATETGTRDAGWKNLMEEMREWTEDRLEERDARIKMLENGQRTMQAELDSVHELLTALRRKYRAALETVAAFLRAHPDTTVPIPPSVSDDL